jgi:hypothetical protein
MGRFRTLILSGFAGVALACSAAASSAAEITVASRGSVAYVQITGLLRPGDEKVFSSRVLAFESAVVELSGLGGSTATAMQIGRTISLKGFVTVVPDGSVCASACALAWLGGRQLFKGPRALIGFRSAGGGQGPLGAYLRDLSLPGDAVAFVAGAPTAGMAWLDSELAVEVGLQVSPFDVREAAPATPAGDEEAPSDAPSRAPIQAVSETGPERTSAAIKTPAE